MTSLCSLILNFIILELYKNNIFWSFLKKTWHRSDRLRFLFFSLSAFPSSIASVWTVLSPLEFPHTFYKELVHRDVGGLGGGICCRPPPFFYFLGPRPQQMEVPGLGVRLELQLSACTTATARPDPSFICHLGPSSWQCWILNPRSEARDRTLILMDTSQVPDR